MAEKSNLAVLQKKNENTQKQLLLEMAETLYSKKSRQRPQSKTVESGGKRKKTISIKRFRVLPDGTKEEVPNPAPLDLSDTSLLVKEKERQICMTPDGRKVIKVVRSVSKSKRNTFDFQSLAQENDSILENTRITLGRNAQQSNQSKIVMPLDWP